MRIQCAGMHGRPVYVQVGENVKIHPTAMFGPDVRIGDITRVGAHCQIGAHGRITGDVSLYAHATIGEHSVLNRTTIGAFGSIGSRSVIVQCTIEERVKIGSHATCYTYIIRRGVQIGHQFYASGDYHNQNDRPIIAQAIIGDEIKITGRIYISSPQARRPTIIGNKTEILDPHGARGDFTIAEGVSVHEGCRIEETSTGKWTIIGLGTQIEKAKIGQKVIIGEHSHVRPTVVIPDHWEVPRYSIVNPGPSTPIVIPK